MARTKSHPHYSAIVIGVSFGGLQALQTILPPLPADFPVPIMVVQHHDPQADDFLARHLDSHCSLRVKVAAEKEKATAGTIYLAPPNYHLLIEDDHTFSLSYDEKVNYARPSIDVLFESGADVYGKKLIGVILTGANSDGSKGLRCIKQCGGIAVVQEPLSATAASMPEAAIAATQVDYITPLDQIGALLRTLLDTSSKSTSTADDNCDTI